MPNPNPARAAKLAAAIAEAFGESFTFLPFTKTGDVNLPNTPDVSRTQFDAAGTWDGPTKSDLPNARTTKDKDAHGWTVSHPCVVVADAALAWTPRRGDRVKRQLDGSVYEINTSDPDGLGSTFFFLTAKQ